MDKYGNSLCISAERLTLLLVHTAEFQIKTRRSFALPGAGLLLIHPAKSANSMVQRIR